MTYQYRAAYNSIVQDNLNLYQIGRYRISKQVYVFIEIKLFFPTNYYLTYHKVNKYNDSTALKSSIPSSNPNVSKKYFVFIYHKLIVDMDTSIERFYFSKVNCAFRTVKIQSLQSFLYFSLSYHEADRYRLANLVQSTTRPLQVQAT